MHDTARVSKQTRTVCHPFNSSSRHVPNIHVIVLIAATAQRLANSAGRMLRLSTSFLSTPSLPISSATSVADHLPPLQGGG